MEDRIMDGFQEGLSGAAGGASTGAMVGGPWGAVIGGGIGALTGFLGGRGAAKKRRQAQKALEEQQRKALESYDKQDLTPISNPFANFTADPTLRNAQMNSLNRYSDIVNSKGSDPLYAEALQQAKMSEESRLRGERGATLRDANRRGINNLGFMNNLMNAQQSSTRESLRNTSAAGEQYGRLLQALNAQGTLAGNISNQDFDQSYKKSAAQMEMDRFNRNLFNTFHSGRAGLLSGQGTAVANNLNNNADRQDATTGAMFNSFASLAGAFPKKGLSSQSNNSLETPINKGFQTQNDITYSNPNKPKFKIGSYS
jgi:hypothetical protein